MASQQELVKGLAGLLNELINTNDSGARLVDQVWCQGDAVRKHTTVDFPEDLIMRPEGKRMALSAMGALNTVLVRLGGEDTDRLMAVEDDDGVLVRFEVGPYGTRPKAAS